MYSPCTQWVNRGSPPVRLCLMLTTQRNARLYPHSQSGWRLPPTAKPLDWFRFSQACTRCNYRNGVKTHHHSFALKYSNPWNHPQWYSLTMSYFQGQTSIWAHTLSSPIPPCSCVCLYIPCCQGLTLDCVGIDLTQDVFTHGQLYTAISRVIQTLSYIYLHETT